MGLKKKSAVMPETVKAGSPPADRKRNVNHINYLYLSNLLDLAEQYKDDKAILDPIDLTLRHWVCRYGVDIDLYLNAKDLEKSAKWSTLLINSFILYSAASGAISGLLPWLIAEGILVAELSLMTIGFTVVVIPAVFVLPYLVYQLVEGVNKTELSLRIKELVLTAQECILRAECGDRQINFIENPTELQLEPFRLNRKLWNSTTFQSGCLFLTLVAFGVTFFSTFSLASLAVGLTLIGIASLTVSLGYAHYHAQWKGHEYEKSHLMDFKSKQNNFYEKMLFEEDEVTALKHKILQQKEIISDKDAVIAEKDTIISGLTSGQGIFSTNNDQVITKNPLMDNFSLLSV